MNLARGAPQFHTRVLCPYITLNLKMLFLSEIDIFHPDFSAYLIFNRIIMKPKPFGSYMLPPQTAFFPIL